MQTLDDKDRNILNLLQRDTTMSLDALSEAVHLSRNACWRRIKSMEDAGIVTDKVALVDPEAVGLPLLVLIQVRTNTHSPEWLEEFARAVRTMPEILSAYRMTGDLDYLIRARVADMAGYDQFYQELISRVPLSDVSASFVMEEIKHTTALPL